LGWGRWRNQALQIEAWEKREDREERMPCVKVYGIAWMLVLGLGVIDWRTGFICVLAAAVLWPLGDDDVSLVVLSQQG